MSSVVHTPRGTVQLGDFKAVLSLPDRYVNDHCFVEDRDGVWHFFGIVGPIGKSCHSQGSETSFVHATSPDLFNWTMHDEVMRVTGQWPETAHVFAPNVIKHDGSYFMMYTAVDDARNERLCLATSDDLFDWKRDAGKPVIVPSLTWAHWPVQAGEKAGCCRDPHLQRLSDGRFVAYWVSEMKSSFGNNLTCIAASVSHDLRRWQEVGWTNVLASDDPFDFRGCVPERIGYAHAAEVFPWRDKWWISHCSSDPALYRYRPHRTHGLFIGQLDWPAGGLPKLSPA